MGKPFQGSINFSKLLAQAQIGHSAFSRAGKNNDIFVSITMWENDEPDKFGFTRSICLNPKQDSGDEKVYFANLKPSEAKQPEPLEAGASDIPNGDDLPF